ncbi:MAG: ribosome rescue GTPase HflX [Candidatus Berkiellales bacterium]
MFERPSSGERAVLVQVTFRYFSEQSDLSELSELVVAAGMEPVATTTSVRDKPDPKFFIGKGKLEDLAGVIQGSSADVVVFNHELSPSQERNIERQIKCRVLSRTGLILAIFARRARTFEGKLQVELAQLEHQSTRLVRGWTHLERQKGGIGLRGGPGETQLEADRRMIREKIAVIKKRLEKVKLQRQQSRHARQRAEVQTISLVGYTNAGKSTLFNMLTGSHVWVANQLFATLDPTLRSIELKGIGRVVLADTVGFIQNLPHTLVDAFRATLEETCQASLLLHVVDASNEKYEDNIHQVDLVLAEIGANHIPQLLVFNKTDLLNGKQVPGEVERNKEGLVTKIWISALKNQGCDLLLDALQGRLSNERVHGVLRLSGEQGQVRAQLYAAKAVVGETTDNEDGWEITIDMTKFQWEKLCQQHVGLSDRLLMLSMKRG